MRHNNNNNNNNYNYNSRRSFSLLVAALSLAAAQRSHPRHHHPRQPAATAVVGSHTSAAVAVVVVSIAVSVSNDDNGNGNDDTHAGCLTEGPAAPPVHQAGVTACRNERQRLTKSTGSETRATKPTNSEIRPTKPILASEIRAAIPMGSSSSSSSSSSGSSRTSRTSRARCGAGLRAARVARGGCTEHRRRLLSGRARRKRRPLRRFLAPALVWVFAAVVDYDLWWKQGSATSASATDGDASTHSFGSMIAGRVAEAIAVNRAHFVCFHILLVLALLSHVAVTFADPGFCPPREASFLTEAKTQESGRWCGHCRAFKPPRAHHCRRCGGCVARMDHHCIYAANCVGAGNHKQFILLLLYSASCAAHANFLYFRVLGRGRVDGSANNTLSSVTGASAASAAAAATTAAQYSASAWQGASTSSSSSSLSLLIGGGGGGGTELRGWRGVVSMARGLLLQVLAVAVLSWLVALLSVHLYGVAVDAGTVDRMQAASLGRSAEESAAATAVVATDSAGERERRLLLYRGRAVPSPRGPPTPSGGLFGFLEGELDAGAALRNSAGNSNNNSNRRISSSSSGGAGGGGAAAPPAAGESARSAAISLICRREGGTQAVAEYPRGPLATAAATAAAPAAGAVVESSCEERRGTNREATSLRSVFCGRCRTLREEVLGDGPWVMWFVPSSAKLAPEVRERVFARPQGQKGDMRFCGPAR